MLEKLFRLMFFIFLISIPLGTRKFIFSFAEPISELNSIFLYASDILLFLFLFFVFYFYRASSYSNILKNIGIVFLLVFLAFAFLSVFLAAYKSIAVYSFLRLVLAVLGALATAQILRWGSISFGKITVVLAGSAVFQAIVGFLQFKFQQSLGLWLLGESAGKVFTKSLATIRASGGTLLRSYGTMSHANIFAAFLIVGLTAFYYLYFRTKNNELWKRIFISVGIFLILLGLVLSFSRSGWIVAGLTTILMLIWGLFSREYRRATLNLLITLVTCFLLLVAIFGWAIFPRAHLSMKDSAISDRYIFNLTGLEIIKDRPFGVGIGNQLQYAIDNGLYLERGLTKPYSWQPIHNLYLLIASEIGILGLLAFLISILKLVGNNWKLIKDKPVLITNYQLLITVLVFGLFDHFFWDLQSGRLMMWLIFGIMMGLSPHSSKDRA